MLDTANLKDITQGITTYPLSGVTTNPSLIKAESPSDFFGHLKKIREIIGPGRSLHVQTVCQDCEGIRKDAARIRSVLGENTYVKIPVTEEGLKAIRILAQQGCRVTATAIYTTMQGMLAALSGAQYLAVYYNRMMNIDIDANKVIKDLSGLLWANSGNCKLLAASFKNINQITSAYTNGASACTVGYELLQKGLHMPSIQEAVDDFGISWRSLYGDKAIWDL